MVTVSPEFFWANRDSRSITYFVAEDEASGDVIGTVTGVDHQRLFGDPERGSSLWCLAVDPQCRHPGVGEMLVRRLAEHFQARGAAYMDLSVMHDNEQAIALYEKLGFRRVPIFAVKRKNPINERLFAGPIEGYDQLNPYARIIVDEARRRGVQVEVTDAEGGFFRLAYGGRSVHCRESLSEMTSGVAVSICDDKAVTRRVVEHAGLKVPEQISVQSTDDPAIEGFLKDHGTVVVKPARGEQGRGVSVGLETLEDTARAIASAREVSNRVLLEACFDGEDLRLVVINYRLVAAAVRRPPSVVGDGERDVRTLIERQSRRRSAATGGESTIPIDEDTIRCLKGQDCSLDTVLASGREIIVRKTANLHTGGSIHDVTGIVHPRLVDAACAAARAIKIPVVGIDFMVRTPTEPDYVFIEANERPGLANHEPQPTAERFVDLLFPHSQTHPCPQFTIRAAGGAGVTKLRIDTDYLADQLRALLAIDSPTGFTDTIVRYCTAELERLGMSVELTRRGAIRAVRQGSRRSGARAIITHLDTLGAQVKMVRDNGRLELVPIGHWSSRFAEGARANIYSYGATNRGSILPLKASGHTFNEGIDEQPVSWENLEMRIDARTQSRAETLALGIDIGDIVAIDPETEFMDNGFIVSRHLDDKAGVAASLAALQAMEREKVSTPVDIHWLFTIAEEVGVGATAIVSPEVASMVAIDNGTSAPGQNSSEFGVTIAMADQTGPFDYHLTKKLIDLCRENDIPMQRDIFRFYRSDSASAVEAGHDVRTALVAFGVDASHGYERIHMDALESIAELVATYVTSPVEIKRDLEEISGMKGFTEQPSASHDGE